MHLLLFVINIVFHILIYTNKIYYKDDNGDGNYSEGVHPNSFGHEKFIAPKIKLFLEFLIN